MLAILGAPSTSLAATQAAPGAEATAPAQSYPHATRQAPQLKATPGHAPYLRSLLEKSQQQQWQAVVDAVATPPADLNAFERALAFNAAGLAAVNLGKLDAAEDFLRRAVDANGLDNARHFTAMRNLALLQHQRGKSADALSTIARYRSESGSAQPEVLAFHAQLLHSAGRQEEAAATYEQLATQQPGNKEWLMNAVAIRQALGDEAAALRLLGQGWRAGVLTEANEYRNLYVGLAKPDTLAEAVAVLDDAWSKGVIARNDATSNDYQALAQIAYLGLRDNALAARLYQRADEAASNGEAALNLARVLYDSGRRDEARQSAQRALEKGVSDPKDARTILQPD